jgi:hypothetical protein
MYITTILYKVITTRKKFQQYKNLQEPVDTELDILISVEHSLVSERHHDGWWFMHGLIYLV